MKEYFKLQFRITDRRIRDFGITPIIAYLAFSIGFVLFSEYLFLKTEFAEYFILLIAIHFISKLSERERNDFLKICFKDSFKKIRLIENCLVSLPFLALFVFKGLFISTSLLILFSFIFAQFNFNTNFSFTLPTPFYKRPFEFIVGFRNTFLLFPIAYSITGIGTLLGNLNLGIFSILLIFTITLSYYTKPEKEYFVWTYKLSPVQFLFTKIWTALIHSTLLIIPTLLILLIRFHDNLDLILAFLAIGYGFLICMIAAKYSAYPNEVGITQGILFALCIYFPPLMIATIPYLFYQSINRLKLYLK